MSLLNSLSREINLREEELRIRSILLMVRFLALLILRPLACSATLMIKPILLNYSSKSVKQLFNNLCIGLSFIFITFVRLFIAIALFLVRRQRVIEYKVDSFFTRAHYCSHFSRARLREMLVD